MDIYVCVCMSKSDIGTNCRGCQYVLERSCDFHIEAYGYACFLTCLHPLNQYLPDRLPFDNVS